MMRNKFKSLKHWFNNLTTEQRIVLRTGISFTLFSVFIVAGLLGWRWLYKQPQEDGIQKPLRDALNKNEQVFKKIFSEKHEAQKYTVAEAVKNVRVNGNIGLGNDFDAAAWKLKLVYKSGDTVLVSLDEIKKLPKTEVIFDFKCIEGWDQVTHWGGVRFSDFAQHFKLLKDSCYDYMGLVTPDGKYYVGIDMPSALQAQTLVCYEMNGKPLPLNQGYPLRLIIPTKYGIKSLKRIGTMYFSNNRPPDYWAEQGYDYYSEL